jgi:hypothetical protein
VFVLDIFTGVVLVVRITGGSSEVDESFIVINVVTVSADRNLWTSAEFCLNTPSLTYNQTVLISYPCIGPFYNRATHTSLIVTKGLNVTIVT